MAEHINAHCAICGKGYHLCISCKDQKNLTPWKIHTDISEHYKIYQILHGLTVGVYNEDEAKEKLGKVDLSDLEDLRDDVKTRIKTILGKATKKVVKTDK